MGTSNTSTTMLAAVLAIAAALACHAVGTTTAILYNDQGQYDRAVSAAREVIASNPDDAEAHFQLGLALSHLDSVALAYQHFKLAVDLAPNDARRCELARNNIRHNFGRHYAEGQEAFRRGSYATAARAYRTATEADPGCGVGFYNLGVTYMRLSEGAPGFLDEAAAAFDTAARETADDDPLKSRALSARVHALVQMKSWDKAVKCGERYLKFAPDDSEMWLQMSVCHQRLGNEKKAEECRARSRGQQL